MMASTTTTHTTNATTKKTFSATEFFAQWQEILTRLIYSTFGRSVGKDQSKERMEQFALDVEAAATSLCVEKGIPTAEREQTEQQLRSSSGLLVPILLTVFFAGQDPPVATNADAFVEENFCINLVGCDGGDIQVPKLVESCNSHLGSGSCFLRAGDCQGEAYLLPGGGVFKPAIMDKPTTRLRKGFEGSEYMREIAAFRVDSAYGGFARVPPTAPVTIFADSLPDREEGSADILTGSLQKWVTSACSSEDMGSSRFNVNDVHRIGILDILLYNTDRHGGNLLVEKSLTCGISCGKGNSRIVPIDHGLCLPDFRHLDQAMFEWQFWKQADQPLSAKDLQLIASFDGDKVAGILRGLGLPSGAVLTARIMVAVLQQTALKRKWTLRQIGTFSSTHFTAESSALAETVQATVTAADAHDTPTFEEHGSFMAMFNRKLEEHLDKDKKMITVITV